MRLLLALTFLKLSCVDVVCVLMDGGLAAVMGLGPSLMNDNLTLQGYMAFRKDVYLSELLSITCGG